MILRATRLSATGNNGGAPPVISGFAYPANTLTSTSTGQWFVDGVAQVGQTGTSFVVPLTAIGQIIQQANSNVLTCWHPNQIPAVARFWQARSNAFNSISPDVLATDGQTVRRWDGIISGTQADQTIAASQPIYRATGQGGNPSIQFDGGNDSFQLLSNADVFQARSQGYLIAGVRDTNPTGGTDIHPVVFYSTGNNAAASRLSIFTRGGAANQFTATARRNDSDAFTIATLANNSNYNVLASHGDWSNGFVHLRVNGSVVASTALAGGSGNAQNTPSIGASIGGVVVSTAYLPGHITAVCAINAAISATDLSRIERYMGLLGGLTTIPLV